MSDIYQPAGGLFGKVRRFAARAGVRRPITVAINEPIVSFTFDDFPRSAALFGAPMLERRGWRGTFYTAMGFLGTTTHLGEMMQRADIEALHARGHEIACHTYAHLDASHCDPEVFADDCERNCAELMDLGILRPRTSFAFPYGEATPAIKRALQPRYGALRGVRHGVNRKGDDLNLLKAVALDGGKAGLDKALRAIHEARREPGWLIFYGHDVRENPSEWGCTPDFLATICAEVDAQDLPVLTVGETLAMLSGEPARATA
ncbi:MAG TPA: polysaccharide deacetylase [Oceanicaulis sp.]|jgi:peptidoglycan/xylan/chitin deacetylase (PgdA/CDA1 family)|uniref:Chitooligosaccharide deacetylase n=1 Tax=Glycocaulis albus TaxID=1382801 RepID=A0ABQ1XIL7_9PROT|nr:polysaccharide deacetylase family protein [Glycocaulis albus]GGG94526.1 polysaccharide deacetylase [Glycocaulis albus]HCY55587.1 polysaccharide deacetylase [Oceanicaulis sp.]